MTQYVYMGRTIQRLGLGDAEEVAESLMAALKDDPVLHHVEMAISAAPPFTTIDVRAMVGAKGDDKLATLCAFASADETLRVALEEVGLSGSIARSQMAIA